MKKAIFTISSANYFNKALILLESALRHSTNTDVFYLIVDQQSVVDNFTSKEWRFNILQLNDLPIENLTGLTFQYDVTELNTAVKPYVFEYLFKNGYTEVVYFDPDIKIYSDLSPMLNLFDHHDALVTPHITEPLPFDGQFPTNWEIIWGGQFNFGFFGLKKTDSSLKFLEFWLYELNRTCIADLGRYFYDQLPGSIVTSMVDSVKVIRSHSYNVAYWNLCQRHLFRNNDFFFTKDGPLVFFHFSGLNEKEPLHLTRHSLRSKIEQNSPTHDLVVQYINESKNNKNLYKQLLFDYSFDNFNDGSPISREDRHRYLSLSERDKKKIGNPFLNKDQIKTISSFPKKYLTYYELLYMVGTNSTNSRFSLKRKIYNLARRIYSIPIVRKSISTRTRERLMAILRIKKDHVMIR